VATQDDVRRIAIALPGVSEATGGFAFSVDHDGKAKAFVWIWMERVTPKKPRVPNPGVIAARVANDRDKAALLGADPDTFFTEPHYNGFPAVLVRLGQVSQATLQQVITEAWRCQAPKPLVTAYDAGAPIRKPGKPARRTPSAAKRAAPGATTTARPAKQVDGARPASSARPAKRRAGRTV